MKFFFSIFLFLFLAQSSYAKLVLPKILGHNMVLQQGAPVAIWGWADAGQEVHVEVKGQHKKTTADQKGAWKLYLDAMAASFDEASILIKAGAEQIQLDHILVGEVWLCSGQSNMEFAMRKLAKLKPPAGANWPVNEVAEANNNALRIFLVERKKMSPDSLHRGWSSATAPELGSFSAVGYFFAKELNQKLKVPVGIISAAIPGSGIEPWMPADAMLKESFFNNSDSTHRIKDASGKFYTTMIEPLIPFSLKGFLWYQGENNCFLQERLEYTYKMKSLINYWRTKWENNRLPFYYVQIAPYYYSKSKDRPYTVYSEPEFWEAQAAALKISNTTMIATTDLIEDPADLHPVNKWDVGQRLAASALSSSYKVNSQPAMGPLFKSVVKNRQSFVIDFDYKGKGLKSIDGAPLSYFEVEDEKGNYYPASAIIKNNKVWVNAAGVKSPRSVRFGWREDAKPNLFNDEGLPAFPFRTNNKLKDQFDPQ
jgi:sialate O-acetylesterase